jgi:hypothetical protein
MRHLFFSSIALLLAACPALAQEWGSVKGTVVFEAGPLPQPNAAKVDKDQAHCLAKGPLFKDDLVIDAKSRGVKNVIVWLAPVGGGTMPINPKLAAVPRDKVVIDQPMCAFEPRITVMRAGQTLVIKNSSPVAHNSRLTGSPDINGTKNPTIPSGGAYELGGDKALKAEPRPMLLACDIHGWMGGKVGVFAHPYFALTKDDGTFEIKDAPAGKFLIYLQHERAGWLHTPRIAANGVGGSKGQPITIPAGGTLDMGTIVMQKNFLK